MNGREFCYWLQGTFEILEVKEFNSTQTLIIKDHLDLVFKENPNASYPFCNWLQGYLELEDPKVLSEHITRIIQNKLYNVFEHVVPERESVPLVLDRSYLIKC